MNQRLRLTADLIDAARSLQETRDVFDRVFEDATLARRTAADEETAASLDGIIEGVDRLRNGMDGEASETIDKLVRLVSRLP